MPNCPGCGRDWLSDMWPEIKGNRCPSCLADAAKRRGRSDRERETRGRRLREMRESGMSVREIAEREGVSVNRIREIFKRIDKETA